MARRACRGRAHRYHQVLLFGVASLRRVLPAAILCDAAESVQWLQVHTSIVAPVPSCVAWLHRELVFVGTWQGSSQLMHITRHKVQGQGLR